MDRRIFIWTRELLRTLHPRARHVIRDRVENGLDLANLAVLYFEELEDQEGIRPVKRRSHFVLRAVHELEVPDISRMVEECGREDHLFLLVHDVTTIAATRNEHEQAGLQLRLASHFRDAL